MLEESLESEESLEKPGVSQGAMSRESNLGESRQITGFHAHVYYDTVSREAASRVREGLSTRFKVWLGRWHDQPIGPHPQAMYQVAFATEQFGTLVPWLMLNREGLNILVHPETGDDVGDHRDRAIWLGEKLPLNIEFLMQFQR